MTLIFEGVTNVTKIEPVLPSTCKYGFLRTGKIIFDAIVMRSYYTWKVAVWTKTKQYHKLMWNSQINMKQMQWIKYTHLIKTFSWEYYEGLNVRKNKLSYNPNLKQILVQNQI